MAQISMQLVKELRDRTQAGLNDCKSALQEAEGAIEKAVEIILKKGLAKSAKRAGAVAAEGEVAAWVAADKRSAVLVEVNIQTDFAARNADFKQFVESVLTVASTAPEGADLGALPWPGGSGTLEEQRQALVGRLGENIQVRRWTRLSVSDTGLVHAYIHMGGKIGVLLGVQANPERPEIARFADDAAMQVAAMAPLYLQPSEVPQDVCAKQRDIFEGQLVEEGKPEAARPKIVEGKLQKWLKEICLLAQPSVIETDKTVEQVCASVAQVVGGRVSLTEFVRYERGEGLSVPEGPDFAQEAQRMAGLS